MVFHIEEVRSLSICAALEVCKIRHRIALAIKNQVVHDITILFKACPAQPGGPGLSRFASRPAATPWRLYELSASPGPGRNHVGLRIRLRTPRRSRLRIRLRRSMD